MVNWNDAINQLDSLQYGLIKKDYPDDETSYYVVICENDQSINYNTSVTPMEYIYAIKDIDGIWLNPEHRLKIYMNDVKNMNRKVIGGGQ